MLVVHGTEDRILPYESTAARLPALLDDIKLVAIEGGPHNIAWTHPDEVNRALLEFVSASRGDRSLSRLSRHLRRRLRSPPDELIRRDGMPETIAGWKALTDGLLTSQCCAFHRNVEISSRYAWIYRLLPACLKWAGMAAIASHHVRLALFPLRLDADRTGYVDIPRSLGRRRLLLTPGREHDPGDEQRHLQRHLLGSSRLCQRRRWHRTTTNTAAGGAPLCARPRWLRGDRPGTPHPGGQERVRGRSTDGRQSHLGRQHPTPRARAAHLGATQLRQPLVRVRQARLDRLGHQLRGAWTAAGGHVFHLLLPLLGHPRRSRTACVRKRGRGSPATTTAGVGS